MNEDIQNFWQKKNLVLFGLSRKEKSISRSIYNLLIQKGYQVYPVNPNNSQIGSISCYRNLSEIDQKLDGAIMVTNPKISAEIVKQCKEIGIRDFWFQYEAIDDDLKSYCDENGLSTIHSCVLLHQEGAGFPHSLHRFFYRLFKR